MRLLTARHRRTSCLNLLRKSWRCAAVVSALLGAGANAAEVEVMKSAAAACLTRLPGSSDAVEYPQELFLRKESATITVNLVFRGPDEEPDVGFLWKRVDSEFADAIKQFAKGYRVPCLSAEAAPVTLQQIFSFDPIDGRKLAASEPEDAKQSAERTQFKCMTHLKPGSQPSYPSGSAQGGQQGRFLVRLRFVAPDKPPEVSWLAAAPVRSLRDSLEDFLEGLRVPCHEGSSIESVQLYDFVVTGGPRTFLKDMTLKSLVGASRDLPRPAHFDFGTMSCPFDVRLTYYRPYIDNVVKELEDSHPLRRPFLKWLSKLTLKLTEAQQLEVVGDRMMVTVNCGSLNL